MALDAVWFAMGGISHRKLGTEVPSNENVVFFFKMLEKYRIL